MSSTYPTTLDSLSTAHSDSTNEIIHAASVNDLADAVNKIETELGTLPKGSAADVKTRIGNTETVANAAVPKSTVTTNGDLIVGTGASTVSRLGVGAGGTVLKGGTTPAYATIVNADVDAAAGITAGKLADPTAGKVLGSAASACAAVFPPGYDFGSYVEITTNASITATTGATANTVVTAGAVTLDGATTVWVTFGTPDCVEGTNSITVVLYDGSTELGQLIFQNAPGGVGQIAQTERRRLVNPAAGSHTYSARAWVDAGTGTVGAGTGAAGALMPAYIVVTKA